MQVSISHTTRKPKQNEQDGVDYYFVSEAEFTSMKDAGVFVESAKVFGHDYATAWSSLDFLQQAGKQIILEVDWQGACSVRKKMDTQSIFILPPSRQALLLRLEQRAREDSLEIKRRFEEAINEMRHCTEFDFILINKDFETCCAALKDRLLGVAQQDPPHPPAEFIRQLLEPA